MDNSLLSGSVFSSSNSSGGNSTLDSDSEDRHPGPVSGSPSSENPTSLGSAVNTPVQREGGGDTGTIGDQTSSGLVTAAEEGAEFNNFQFWRSPVSAVGGKGEFQAGLGLPLQLTDLEGEDENDDKLPGSEASSGNLCDAQEFKVGPQRQQADSTSGVASGTDEAHVTIRGRKKGKDDLPDKAGATEDISEVGERLYSGEGHSGNRYSGDAVQSADVTTSVQNTGSGSRNSQGEQLEKGEKEEAREGGDGELSQPGGCTGTVTQAVKDKEKKEELQESETEVSSSAELKGERIGGSGVLADQDELNIQPKSTTAGPQEPLQSVEGQSDSSKDVRTPVSLQGKESGSEKKRRWSLEKNLQTENNTFPQVLCVVSDTGMLTRQIWHI